MDNGSQGTFTNTSYHNADHLDPQITQCCAIELEGDEEVNHTTFFQSIFPKDSTSRSN